MQDAQGLINGTLNAAMMCAFAIPGGQPFGAGFAILTAVINATWSDPDGNQSYPVTQKELKDSLANLKSEIDSSLYGSKIDDMVNNGAQYYTDFQGKSVVVKRLLADPASLDPNDTDVSTSNTFFDLYDSNQIFSKLGGFRNAMELSSVIDLTGSHRTRTLNLYCFVSMFMCALSKVAVNWEWGYKLAVNAQYDAYQKDVADWRAHDLNYRNQHPFSDLIMKYPALPRTTIPQRSESWKDYSTQAGGKVQKLFQEIDHMISYATADKAKGDADNGLYTFVRASWDDLDKQVSSYDLGLSSGQRPTAAQVNTAVSNGMSRAKTLDRLMNDYLFRGDGWEVAEADMDALGSAIDVWRASEAEMRFQAYAVAKKDTFAQIANTFYRDPSYATKIFEMNKEAFPKDTAPDDASLVPGMVLKIYTRDDIQLIESGRGVQNG